VDLAADWLSTVLALEQVAELPDANALRARALDLKSTFEREAGTLGFSAADTADAVFALVAFLDSVILNHRGAARDVWVSRPLQLELYGHQLAGEQFFDRLEALRAERESRIEALEVYYCCLAFGYKGRYLLFPERLPALLEQVQQDIAAVRDSGFSPLAPNSGRRKERVAEERRGLAWWVPLAVFVPAVLVAWTLVWLVARLAAGGAASAITKVTTP
jgi:type VI secretion system protein ImpK